MNFIIEHSLEFAGLFALLFLLALAWLMSAERRVSELRKEVKHREDDLCKASDEQWETTKLLNKITSQNSIMEKKIENYESSLFGRDAAIAGYKEVIANLEGEILDSDKKIERLETVSFSQAELIESLNDLVGSRNSEIQSLKTRLTHKNQPRDAGGHFARDKSKKNPDIGKYLCTNMMFMPNPQFTEGKLYRRYEQRTPIDGLILIGDDRSRHMVEAYKHRFKLITE